MKITVQSNLPKLDAQIKAYKPGGFDLYKQDIETARQAQVSANFANQSDSDGNKWPGLAPATLKQRIRLGFGAGPILRRLGGLENAAINARVTTTPTSFTATIADPKLAKIGGILNSKRNFFYMGAKFTANIMQIITRLEIANIESALKT